MIVVVVSVVAVLSSSIATGVGVCVRGDEQDEQESECDGGSDAGLHLVSGWSADNEIRGVRLTVLQMARHSWLSPIYNLLVYNSNKHHIQ